MEAAHLLVINCRVAPPEWDRIVRVGQKRPRDLNRADVARKIRLNLEKTVCGRNDRLDENKPSFDRTDVI